MLESCSKCGYNNAIPMGVYGSPILTCCHCGEEFFSNKIFEPALCDLPEIKKHKLGIATYFAAGFSSFCFIFFLLVGFIEKDLSILGNALVPGLVMTISILYIIYTYRKYNKLHEERMEILEESRERLRYKSYQKKLLELNSDKDFFDKLSEFNSNNKSCIIDDIRSSVIDLTIDNNNFQEKNSQTKLNVDYSYNRLLTSKIVDYYYCRKCGKKVPNDSVFCYYCGTRMVKIND